MVPIVLFLFDVAVLVLANTANDNLAKQAARAAASAVNTGISKGDYTSAKNAAQAVVNKFTTSGYINQVSLAYIYYNAPAPTGLTQNSISPIGGLPAGANLDPGVGNVAVVVMMNARAPVPFPGFDTSRVYTARAVEPIVSLPP